VRTALDSSVLLLILRRQPGWEQWQAALDKASAEGALVFCPVVFAECSIGFPSVMKAREQFEMLGIAYDPISTESAWLAGQTFLDYRRQKGTRDHLIPDFLIAAHASLQADRIAALDRGYLRRYFPKLPFLGL